MKIDYYVKTQDGTIYAVNHNIAFRNIPWDRGWNLEPAASCCNPDKQEVYSSRLEAVLLYGRY